VEVLAAVFLTAVVMTIAISFFVEISDATDAAAARARQGRHAIAVLDRMARDLEGAYLISKPEELDPLLHPWAFVADGQAGGEGADRVQFVTRSHRPRNRLGHGSDVAVVTWMLHPSDDGPGYELLRAVSPGLPDPPGNEFPSADDERFMVVAEGIASFGMRFLAPESEWLDEWDSTQLELSSMLPEAADLEIAFLPETSEAAGDPEDVVLLADLADAEEGEHYSRRVLIPMRPVDVEEMIRKAQEDAAQDGSGGRGSGSGDDVDDGDPDDLDDSDFESLEDEVERLLQGGDEALREGRRDNMIR
jgi:hypothetical protein